MIEETFTDDERHVLGVLVARELVGFLAEPEKLLDDGNAAACARLTDLLGMLSGVDTVLIARRAYPSKKVGRDDEITN